MDGLNDFFMVIWLIMVLSMILCAGFGLLSLLIEIANAPESRIIRNKKWIEKVTDEKLEEAFEEYMLNPENREELYEKIGEAEIKIPLYKEGNIIPLVASDVQVHFSKFSDDNKRNIAKENRKQILRWLMATRGKLLVEDVEDGITFRQRGIDDYGSLPSVFRENIEDNINFVLWIRSELTKHGVKAALHVKHIGKTFSIDEHSDIGGTYLFEMPDLEPITQKCPICDNKISKKTIICPKCRCVIRSNINRDNVFHMIFKLSGIVLLCSMALSFFNLIVMEFFLRGISERCG